MKIYRIIILTLLISICNCSIAYASEKSTIIVAAVQLQTEDAGNFSKMRDLVKRAKVQGADLVIFPEESIFGWLNPNVFLEATPIPGKYSDEFAAIAKDENIWLATGLAEQGPEAGPDSQKNAHQVYNSGILINPEGKIVLHHRQFNVVNNAFDLDACKGILNKEECRYIPGDLSDIEIVDTLFGKTSILVCADAFTHPSSQALDTLKELCPDFVIIFWGISASTKSLCGLYGFNAAIYTQEAATYLNHAFVVGANAVGTRYYGRFLPSEYCGHSGYSTPTGECIEMQPFDELIFFYINKSLYAEAI